MVQDLSHNAENENTNPRAFAAGALVITTIQTAFRPGAGSGPSLLLSNLSDGKTEANTILLSSAGKYNPGSGSRIAIVDLTYGQSVADGRKSGIGALIGYLRVGSGEHALALSDVGGKEIVISLDRLIAKIKAERLDPNNKDDREKIKKLVEHVVAHELGHNLGLNDNKEPHDLMNEDAPSFNDQNLTSHMKSDIDKAADSLERRAI